MTGSDDDASVAQNDIDPEDGSWWNSTNLPMPIHHFARLFKLTEKEVRREGVSARFVAMGYKDGQRFHNLFIRESEVRRWILHPDLPPRVRAKVRRAGGLDALEGWRKEYFKRVRFDVENNAIWLPDGTRVTDVRVKWPPPKLH